MANDLLRSLLPADFKPQSDDDWRLLDAVAQEIFRPARPIDEDKLFSGRINQIRDLLDVIYRAGAHAIVFGERGVGKTSLARIIDQKVIGSSTFIKVLPYQCGRTDDFVSIWGNIFFDYKYDGKDVVDILRERPQPFTVYKVAQSLAENTRLLIVIDEFDQIRDEQTKALIADTIKYLSDHPIGVTVVVVGVGSSIETLFGSHPSIKRCCQQIRMQRMSPAELRQIVQGSVAQLHMTIDGNALEQMVTFSHGLPGYMHLLGLEATRVALRARTQHITFDHFTNAVQEAVEHADESTQRDYQKAIQSTKPDNRYRQVLLACALAKKNRLGQFSASDVSVKYSEIMEKEMGIESFARHLNAFCTEDRGPVLIQTGKPKRYLYHFCDPLLEPLVLMIGRHKN